MDIARRKSCDMGDTVREHATSHIQKERRSILSEQTMYVGIIEKVPIFSGLTLEQFKKILHICSREIYTVDKAVIQCNDESCQMFILIKGMLKVVFPNGKELSRISPVEIVGEMGVFTGERRSASVVAMEESTLLSIHKNELLELFRSEGDLGIHILMNVIREIAHKLRKNNSVIEDLKKLSFPGEYALGVSKTQKEPQE